MGVDAHLSDLQNRVESGRLQCFQNKEMCSVKEPKQVVSTHFHIG